MKISEIKTTTRLREGFPGAIHFVDIWVDGRSLYDLFAQKLDFISCLGWGNEAFQKQNIARLLCQSESDFSNYRNSIYICPACADLGCGAISVLIERKDNIVSWSEIGMQNNFLDSIHYYKEIKTFYFDYEQYKLAVESTEGVGSYMFPWDQD